MSIVTTLLLLLIFFAGIIWLQIFLSRKENRWAGLILPGICLCFSLILVFSVMAYSISGDIMQVTTENGVIVHREAVHHASDAPLLATNTVLLLLLYNIPTAVLLAIYFVCQGEHRKKRALEKMQAQDLD